MTGPAPLLDLVRQLEDDAVRVDDVEVFGLIVDIAASVRGVAPRADAVGVEAVALAADVVRRAGELLWRISRIPTDAAGTLHVGRRAMTPAELAVVHLRTLARCASSIAAAATAADARALASLGEEIEARFGRGFEMPAPAPRPPVTVQVQTPPWAVPAAVVAVVAVACVGALAAREPSTVPAQQVVYRVVPASTGSASPSPAVSPTLAAPLTAVSPTPQLGVLDRLLAWLRGLVSGLVSGR